MQGEFSEMEPHPNPSSNCPGISHSTSHKRHDIYHILFIQGSQGSRIKTHSNPFHLLNDNCSPGNTEVVSRLVHFNP
jgi:hypothetical protein